MSSGHQDCPLALTTFFYKTTLTKRTAQCLHLFDRLAMAVKPWSGWNLRLSYYPLPPYSLPYRDSSGRERLHGFFGSLMDNITESLNMTYTILTPFDGAWGHVDEETGELHGSPRMVLDGNADIVVGPMIAHDGFFQKLHELHRVSDAFSKSVFVFGFKDEYVTTTPAFTEAVDLDTWLGLLVCAAMLIALAMVFHGFVNPRREVSLVLTFTRWSFTFFGILLQEATSTKPPTLWFDRLLRGVWMMGCMLFSYIFLGTLRANLIVLTPTERINDLATFLTRPEKPIFFGYQSPAEWIIELVPGANGDKLREHFRQNQVPIDPFTDMTTQHVMEQMVQAKGVLFYEWRAIVRAVSTFCVTTNYFFHVMPERVSRIDGVMYSSKALPKELNRELDRKISWLQAHGVPFMREREVLAGNLECIAGVDKRTSESVRTVVLADLATINTSLIIGLSLAIAAFIAELIVSNCHRCCKSLRCQKRRD